MPAWSYSRLSDFEACPYRFKLKYLEKKPEASSPATERGTTIHQQYEAFMLKDEPCPSSFFEPILQDIKENFEWSVETEWAFDKNWNQQNWFDPSVWVRIKPDLQYYANGTLHIIDYKTGKPKRIPHTSQGQLYAVGGACINPIFSRIEVSFWYHDHDQTYDFTLNKDQIALLKTQWTERAKKINTSKYPPKPNNWNCKYCGMRQHCDYAATI